MPHSPGIGAIFGIVSENGIAKAGGRVGLYDRTTMNLVQKTLADNLGGYVFTGLNQVTSDYLVMALDDDGAPPKNALVQDYIQPIPGHMGSIAYSNWEQRIRRRDPIALWVPRFQTPYPETLGATLQNQTRYIAGGSLTPDRPTMTPGAPQFPSLKLSTGSVFLPSLLSGIPWQTSGPEAASMEFVIDTSFDTQIAAYGTGYATSIGTSTAGMMGFSLVAATRLIRVSSGKATWGISPTTPLSDVSYWNSGTFTPSVGVLPSGPHHFVISVTLASNIYIYIDGVLAGTVSISGTNGNYWMSQWQTLYDGQVVIGGFNGTLGLGVIGPVAVYHKAYDAVDVTAAYNDLMVGTVPTSTGYVREILTDEPAALFRLNDANLPTATEFLTGLPMGTYYNAVSLVQPSPIVGGSMVRFTGGAMRSTRGSGGGSHVQRSWEFWIQPDVSPPPAARTIISGHSSDDSTGTATPTSTAFFWWKVMQLATTGALQLQVLTGAVGSPVNEQITFAYAPPVGVVKHIVIVLDKVALKCYLYVNGVLQETAIIQGSFLYDGQAPVNQVKQYQDLILTVGGWVTGTIVVSEAFLGYLSEVAVYFKMLAPDRIKAHYDARLLI